MNSESAFRLERGRDVGLVLAHFTVLGLRDVGGNNLFCHASECFNFVSCNVEVDQNRIAFPETLNYAHLVGRFSTSQCGPAFGGNQRAGWHTSISTTFCSESVTDNRRSNPVDGANSYEWQLIHGMPRLARFKCTRPMRETDRLRSRHAENFGCLCCLHCF